VLNYARWVSKNLRKITYSSNGYTTYLCRRNFCIMTEEKAEKNKIVALAKKTKHYCELLITQSDSWLPEKKPDGGVKDTSPYLPENDIVVKGGG